MVVLRQIVMLMSQDLIKLKKNGAEHELYEN